MSDVEAELIFDARRELTEGVVWRDLHLWWVSITSGELHCLHASTGFQQTRHLGENISCVVPCEDGRWLMARELELLCLDWGGWQSKLLFAK